MSAEESLTEYYDKKGKVRFMMVTSKEHKVELSRLCKLHGVTQGAMLEAFLDVAGSIDPIVLKRAVDVKRGEKKSSRVSHSSINKKLKGLSKDQLEAIEKAIEDQLARTNQAEQTNQSEPANSV